MKTNRRHFLKIAALGSVLVNACKGESKEKSTAKAQATVISTWNFGVQANAAAWEVLAKNGSALDAIEAGARVPEADPMNQSVGYGGLPDRDGHVTLDACVMDAEGNAGSVCGLEHIMHPISVARLVMEKTPHVILIGEGALDFALKNGFKKENLLTEKSKKDWQEWLKKAEYKPIINVENHDTIGILALDNNQNLSGGCTTSGLAYKMRGRVGDSPIIGAGLYVDNEIGGATATGLGELVLRTCGSFLIVELMRQGLSPQKACEEGVKRVVQKNKNYKEVQIGFLAINKKGEYGAYSLQKGFQYAVNVRGKSQLIDADYFLK
jgi:N4-(beta-N-acetylglucosaminyl)-L-asparaginase